MELTYCNPLSIEGLVSGRALDASGQGIEDIKSIKDYRSIADPSVIFHDGKWIMYPSYSLAYVSEDFVNWKPVDIGIKDLRYSPAVVQFRGKWYLSGHSMPEMYVADSPLGPFKLCGKITDVNGNEMRVADGCYLADGDRLYFYWFSVKQPSEDQNIQMITGTLGAECDPDEPWKLISEPVWINEFDPSQEWQRSGEYNQNERIGWIEGQWMIKRGGRYYLLYSGSATQYSTYANAVIYSDDGPLSNFKPQKNHNPLATKRFGLVRGAGHGCLTEGPNGTLWMFYTCLFNFNFKYERRIGVDPVGFDENGEIFCPGITETPQFAPGVLKNPELDNSAGLLPLTFLQSHTVSSCLPGREGLYALDDSIFTWWQPTPEDADKTLTVNLKSDVGYDVSAIRIIWRDIGMETLDGINPGPFKYVVEYLKPSGNHWEMLVDASQNEADLCIDYRQFEAVSACQLRLRILSSPKGIEPGVCSFTAFGKISQK